MGEPPQPPAASAACVRLTRIALEHGNMVPACIRETLTALSSYVIQKGTCATPGSCACRAAYLGPFPAP